MKKYVNIVIAFMLFVSTNIYANNNINNMLDVDTCSITILPNDTTIYSDTPIQLQLSTNQVADYFNWTPTIGLSNSTISNPIATISSSTQYILEATYLGSNLVYNGDFELGNVGFTTQLNLSTDLWPAGNYNIVTYGSRYHYLFSSCTHDGGNFFVANGASTPNTIVYQATVVVEPNTDYTFSFEATNVSSSTIQSQLPQFQFSVNSQQLGSIFTINPTPCDWNIFHQTWNSGSNTTAIITILNQNTLAGGNDFGLDNISLKKICKAYDTINVTILPTISNVDTCSITIHQNDTTIYSSTPIQFQLSSNQEADYYHWYPSTGLSDTTISNPVATISSSTQYILEATYMGINLINNGDFEQGNTGFYTDLTLLNTGPTQRGIYNVVSNAQVLEAGFCPCNNGGNYMIVDGSETSNVIVYRSQATVQPNTDYIFSLELSTINNAPNQSASQLADLYIYINNSLVENHFSPVAACCNWITLTLPWNSGNNTTATVVIKDHNTTPWGNDFALDNISLRAVCKAYDTINIAILPNSPIITTIDISLCENDFPYTYYDSIFTQASTYGYTFKTNNIIDSLHIVNITLLPSSNDTIIVTIHEGQVYNDNGFNVSEPGFYTNIYQSINGCDSVVNLILSFAEIIPREINISLCERDFPYTYYDSVFTQAGTYGYTFKTNNIVDSLHIVHIILLPSYNDTIFASICEGQTYTGNGFNVSDAGFYTNTSTTINGCDSITNLSLNVLSVEDTIINAVICEGKAYNNYGFNESNSGTYYNYYSFGEECERKVILNLTVIEYPEMLLLPDSVVEVEKYPITIDATCLGCDNYIWSNGVLSPLINIYSQGTYYICVESSCGNYCDSVVIVNPDIYVFLPNSFTPVEHTNNIFRYYTAKDENIRIEAFQIFNRWGEKIFETNQNKIYWDGKYKGNYCPNGVYVWRLLYKTIFTGNQIFEKTGEVNLIK